MLVFLLTAALVMISVDTLAAPQVTALVPPYPIEMILESRIVLDISDNDYRGYLTGHFPDSEALLPDALIGDLTCYSDGTGSIALLDDFKEIWNLFTPSGQFVLNNDMVTIGAKICDKKLEALYGYHIGESSYTWHF